MRRSATGFGLIELMVAMSLGILVMLGATQVFLSARETYLTQSASAFLQEDARYVLSKLGQEIRMVGMFGCLSTRAIIDLPLAFESPIVWERSSTSSSLKLISADVGQQSGRPDWTVVSDCKNLARAYSGGAQSLAPEHIGFPVRALFYRYESGQLKTGINNAVLLENVVGFDLSFGVASSAGAGPVVRYEASPGNPASIRSVRITLTLRDPRGRVKDQTYHALVALRNRLG